VLLQTAHSIFILFRKLPPNSSVLSLFPVDDEAYTTINNGFAVIVGGGI
jgi:hypothetical protein